jgi:hypothetical protein
LLLISPVFGKFDGSGVSGSTGRGRSQALESKVRFADHTATTHFSQETALSDQLWSELGQQPEIAVGKFGKSFRQKPRFAKKSNAA